MPSSRSRSQATESTLMARRVRVHGVERFQSGQAHLQSRWFHLQPACFHLQRACFRLQPACFRLQPAVFVCNRPVFICNRPVFVCNRPVFVCNGPVFVCNRPVFICNRPVFVCNRPVFICNGACFRLQRACFGSQPRCFRSHLHRAGFIRSGSEFTSFPSGFPESHTSRRRAERVEITCFTCDVLDTATMRTYIRDRSGPALMAAAATIRRYARPGVDAGTVKVCGPNQQPQFEPLPLIPSSRSPLAPPQLHRQKGVCL